MAASASTAKPKVKIEKTNDEEEDAAQLLQLRSFTEFFRRERFNLCKANGLSLICPNTNMLAQEASKAWKALNDDEQQWYTDQIQKSNKRKSAMVETSAEEADTQQHIEEMYSSDRGVAKPMKRMKASQPKSKNTPQVEASRDEMGEESSGEQALDQTECSAQTGTSTTTPAAADAESTCTSAENELLKSYPWLLEQSSDSVLERLKVLKAFGFSELKDSKWTSTNGNKNKQSHACRLLSFSEKIKSSAPEGFCQALLEKDFKVPNFKKAFPIPEKLKANVQKPVGRQRTSEGRFQGSTKGDNSGTMGDLMTSGYENGRKYTADELRKELQALKTPELIKRAQKGGLKNKNEMVEKADLVELVLNQETAAGRVLPATSTASAN